MTGGAKPHERYSTKRLLVSSGSPYEPIIGFSRAVRVGNIIAVGGTAAGSSSKPVAIGDPAAQTRVILEIIGESAQGCGREPQGCDPHSACFLSTSPIGEAVGKVHGDFFGDYPPGLEHAGRCHAFINPDWLVEIEADAVVLRRLEEADMAPREPQGLPQHG